MSTQTQQSQSPEDTYLTLDQMLAKPEDELKDMNPDRDPFVAPRVPEGWYIGTVEYREKDANKRWQTKSGEDANGNPSSWYSTRILFKIAKDDKGAESEFAGRSVSPAYAGTVTTKLRKNGSSTVSGICLHAGLKVETKTHGGQAAQLDKVIAQTLPIKAVVRHDLSYSVKEGDSYHTIHTIEGTRNPSWPKTESGELDYAPVTYAIHDPEKGWRLATEADPQDQFVEVTGRVNEVVDRFAPVVN